jgi:hypothetical protein
MSVPTVPASCDLESNEHLYLKVSSQVAELIEKGSLRPGGKGAVSAPTECAIPSQHLHRRPSLSPPGEPRSPRSPAAVGLLRSTPPLDPASGTGVVPEGTIGRRFEGGRSDHAGGAGLSGRLAGSTGSHLRDGGDCIRRRLSIRALAAVGTAKRPARHRTRQPRRPGRLFAPRWPGTPCPPDARYRQPRSSPLRAPQSPFTFVCERRANPGTSLPSSLPPSSDSCS